MALVLADRVQETTNTTGTGTLTLAGAVAGFQSFAVIGNSNTVYYTIVSGSDWESGIGTYTSAGTTLARTTILSSSNGGTAITVTSGASVFCDYPATKAVYKDASGVVSGHQIVLPASTATAGTAPIKFTTGTVLTAAEMGAMEFDGETFFATTETANRGVLPAVHYITQTGNYTTPTGSNNTLKQMFNSSTNGALTVAGNTTYFFESLFNISSMSATAGTLQFGFLGTATFGSILYMAIANKTALGVQTASSHTIGTVKTAVVITASNTTTTGYGFVKGKIVVTTGGTIIPAFALSVANAAVVNTGTYFKIWSGGLNTEVEIGNWS